MTKPLPCEKAASLALQMSKCLSTSQNFSLFSFLS